jgi:Tfp pilus assembly protein PilW
MSAAMTPELQAKLANWRARAAGQGDPLTLEDMREALRLLRQDRRSAAAASDTSKAKKAKQVIPDADDLLDQLMK